MVWVSRWCKVDTGDPFLDTDVSDLLYLWQGDVQKFFDCGFGAILCPEVLWSRIENTWDFWIWMDLDRCVPAFSRRAFMDHSLISSMVYAWSEGTPSLRFLYPDCEALMKVREIWDGKWKDQIHDIEIGPGCYRWHPDGLSVLPSNFVFWSSWSSFCTSCVCFWLHLCHAGSTLWQNYIHLQTSTLHANVNTQLFNLQT